MLGGLVGERRGPLPGEPMEAGAMGNSGAGTVTWVSGDGVSFKMAELLHLYLSSCLSTFGSPPRQKDQRYVHEYVA